MPAARGPGRTRPRGGARAPPPPPLPPPSPPSPGGLLPRPPPDTPPGRGLSRAPPAAGGWLSVTRPSRGQPRPLSAPSRSPGRGLTRAGGGARRPSRPLGPRSRWTVEPLWEGARGWRSLPPCCEWPCSRVRVCSPSPRPGQQRSPGARGNRPCCPSSVRHPPCPCPPLAHAARPHGCRRVPAWHRAGVTGWVVSFAVLARGSSCVSFHRWDATPDALKCVHPIPTPGRRAVQPPC